MSNDTFRKYINIVDGVDQQLNESWKKAVGAGLIGASLLSPADSEAGKDKKKEVQQQSQIVSKQACFNAVGHWMNKHYKTDIPLNPVKIQDLDWAAKYAMTMLRNKTDDAYRSKNDSQGEMLNAEHDRLSNAIGVAFSFNVKPNKGFSLHDKAGQNRVKNWLAENGYDLNGNYIGKR